MPDIAYQAAGTSANGTGTVAPAWPTHASGDIGILLIQTYDDNATLDTANGFELIGNAGGVDGAEKNYLTAYWCRATASNMAAPVVTDMGDHSYARIVTLRNATGTGDPVNVSGFSGLTLSQENNIGFLTTTEDGCGILVVQAWGNDLAGPATSYFVNSYTTLTEIIDEGTTTGTGGGITAFFGVQTTAGLSGLTSVFNTSGYNKFASCAIAILPQLGQSVSVPAASLTLTGYAPIVTTAIAGPLVSVPVGSLTLTGYTPTVRMGDWFDSTDVSTIWTDIEGN